MDSTSEVATHQLWERWGSSQKFLQIGPGVLVERYVGALFVSVKCVQQHLTKLWECWTYGHILASWLNWWIRKERGCIVYSICIKIVMLESCAVWRGGGVRKSSWENKDPAQNPGRDGHGMAERVGYWGEKIWQLYKTQGKVEGRKVCVWWGTWFARSVPSFIISS